MSQDIRTLRVGMVVELSVEERTEAHSHDTLHFSSGALTNSNLLTIHKIKLLNIVFPALDCKLL